MVGLFTNSTRTAIKDLPIYPTRGNHDCYFDDIHLEVNLNAKYPTWQMSGLQYEKQFEVGNGKKIALLMVDSCLLICDALIKSESKMRLLAALNEDTRKLAETVCEQKNYQTATIEMMKWIAETLKKQSEDPDIIWKTSYDHHPLFGVDAVDSTEIFADFFPEIKKHGYDIYFNGHEHMMTLSSAPETEVAASPKESSWLQQLAIMAFGNNCSYRGEYFPQDGNKSSPKRKYTFKKGEKLLDLTIGNGGRPLDDICADFKSAGDFYYIENLYFGYALVHATEEKLTVEYRAAAPYDSTPSEPLLFSQEPDFTAEDISIGQNSVLFSIEIHRDTTSPNLIEL